MRNGSFLRCRLCLGESKLLVLGDELRKLIRDLLIPQIQHWPEPEHVCNTCVDYLKVFQRFKKKVLKVQEKVEATLPSSIHSSTPTTPRIRKDETHFVDSNQTLASNADSIVYAIVRNLDINETSVDRSKNVQSNERDPLSKKLETSLSKARQRVEPMRSDIATIKKEKIDSRGKELLKCTLCDGSFNFAATLETHLRKRHALLKCQSCNYSSNTRRNYVRHIRSHQNLTFKHKVCSICFTICKDSAELFAHRKKVHSSTVELVENPSACTTQLKKKSKSTIRDGELNSEQVQLKSLQESEPREKQKQKSSKENIQSNVPSENELSKKQVKKSRVAKPESNTSAKNDHREEGLQSSIQDENGYPESQERQSNLELLLSSSCSEFSLPKKRTKEAEKPQKQDSSQKRESNLKLPQSSTCLEEEPPKRQAEKLKAKKSVAKKSKTKKSKVKKTKAKKTQLNTLEGNTTKKKRVQSNIQSQNQELSTQLIPSSTPSERRPLKEQVENLIAEKPRLNLDETNEHSEERVQSNTHNESRCRESQNRELNLQRPQSSTRPESVIEENRELEESWTAEEIPSQSFVIDRNSMDNETPVLRDKVCQKTVHLVKKFRCPKSCGRILSQYFQYFDHHLRYAYCTQGQTDNRLYFICEICQFSAKRLSNYIKHVYKWHTRESNQQGYVTHRGASQNRYQSTPKKDEMKESMTKKVERNQAAGDSYFLNSSSRKKKPFDESSNAFYNSERVQKRKRYDSRSSNHEYNENQSFQGNIGNERRGVSTCRFESNSFRNRNSSRPPSKRHGPANHNSRRFITPNTELDYQVSCSPFDSATTNPTKSNYQVQRSPIASQAHQQRGYQNKQRSKIVECLHDESRQNVYPEENTSNYDRKGAGIKWKMKLNENTRDEEKKFQWRHESGSALSDTPLNFGTIKCTLEKIDDKGSIPPDVKPSLETIHKNIATQNRWQNHDSTESSLKYYCNLCGKLEIHSTCAGCGLCFRSMSLYVDHMRKRH